MALTTSQIAEQKKQAEELLFSEKLQLGFAKALFFGEFHAPMLFPYPELSATEKPIVEKAVEEVRRFADEHIDAAAIDRNADIPRDVIDGLARLGVLGMTAPAEFGGRGFSQLAYTKILQVIGAHCSSTAVFVNAHHSIGVPRPLVLFGTKEQQARWLPRLVSGQDIAAFALTEPEAGSDAANVQTTATPSPDGKHWILNGEKRYITNGAIAQVLTVMARTPVPGSNETKITAFLVTPDMPGFEVREARMEKCGIRGTATAWLRFNNMPVPIDNVLGPLGKGLRIALTVLDFGRTTFGASRGVARTCLTAAIAHAHARVQFKEPIGEFELVKKKIAYMAAHAFAMEATTAQCAAFIDRGAEDYMLETAMLKVFSTEALWTIVNDTLQIYGGQGYFTRDPYERMMRDARINTIGEGANDVLKAFIAVVGMRGIGEHLKGILDALKHPLQEFNTLWTFGRSQITARFTSPEVPVKHSHLLKDAHALSARVRDFGLAVIDALRHFRSKSLELPSPSGRGAGGEGGANAELKIMEVVLKSQYMQERLADAACDLYASSCTLARLDRMMTGANGHTEVQREIQAGRYFLAIANRRIKQNLAALWDNDDGMTTATAEAWLEK